MASWESDQLTVVLKQGIACDAKGPQENRGAGRLSPDSEPDQGSQENLRP